MAERRPRKAAAPKTAAPTRKIRVKHVEEPKKDAPDRVIVFDKKIVLRVLPAGHTKTHFHCQMSGGVTMHVPKRLF